MLKKIEQKVLNEERLTFEDGLTLFKSSDLAYIGYLADIVRKRKNGDKVYYNVNCHVNLTNICVGQCKFCAFGRDKDAKGAYSLDKNAAIKLIEEAMQDPNLSGLHVVSGMHPDWTFDDYLEILEHIHKVYPKLYLKGFTAVEITHFAKISNLTVEEVLKKLIAAGVEALPGGGAEILTDRVRNALCPNKATAAEWLDVHETAHKLGLKTNASMLYGHIETLEERLEHLIKLRDLQDKTGGFQTFICFPFLPKNTPMEEIKQTSMWDDLRTMAISRLMLDNFPHIKAYWVMLTVPVAQVALGFGADDIDGTVHKEKILHDAGATSPTGMTEDSLITVIKEAGRIPVQVDCNYKVIRTL